MDPKSTRRSATAAKPVGYHLAEIPRGVYGHVSKVVEEALELQDAHAQGNRIMELAELADLYGAMKAVLDTNFPEFCMDDLRLMSLATRRAFEAGHRTEDR